MDVVVINLARHPGRLEQFRRQWVALGLRDFDVFTAIDKPNNAAAGCYASHLQVLQRADGPVAVFEDDAIFARDFTLDVEPPEPAQMIWLGGQHLQPPRPVTPGWVRPIRINRTHAYLALDPQALAAGLLAHQGSQRHVDDAFTSLAVSHLALRPFTVGQGPGVSSTTGRVHRRSRFWNV